MRIVMDIAPCADGDGIDLKIGEMLYRNVSGITARNLGHAEIDQAIDDIAEVQSALEPAEPDYELEQDRNSGTKDHRWPA